MAAKKKTAKRSAKANGEATTEKKTRKPRKVAKAKRAAAKGGKGIAARIRLAFKLGRALGQIEGASQ